MYFFWPWQSALSRIDLINFISQWECNPLVMCWWPSSHGAISVSLQILANVIIFICGNMAGAYHKHLMDLALKQTYQDTCNCIKSPIKLEFEKRQQVGALLPPPGLCCWPLVNSAGGWWYQRYRWCGWLDTRLPAVVWQVNFTQLCSLIIYSCSGSINLNSCAPSVSLRF